MSLNGDSSTYYRIFTECCNRVNTYCKRVAEGRDVQSASEYARWLFFSGIIGLLKENSCDGPLKVDGAHLAWKVEDLTERCNQYFRSNGRSSGVSSSELESVHEKLARVSSNVELLACQVARLTSALGSEEPGGVAPIRPCLPDTAAPLPFLSRIETNLRET